MRIHPTGKSLLIFRNHVKPQNQKYSAGHVGQITGIIFAHPGPHEGRFAIVTMRWAGDAMDALVQARVRRRRWPKAYGEVVWSWRRDAGVKSAGSYPAE